VIYTHQQQIAGKDFFAFLPKAITDLFVWIVTLRRAGKTIICIALLLEIDRASAN
jgi:hypothetical protein